MLVNDAPPPKYAAMRPPTGPRCIDGRIRRVAITDAGTVTVTDASAVAITDAGAVADADANAVGIAVAIRLAIAIPPVYRCPVYRSIVASLNYPPCCYRSRGSNGQMSRRCGRRRTE